jgi:hypothetical protein
MATPRSMSPHLTCAKRESGGQASLYAVLFSEILKYLERKNSRKAQILRSLAKETAKEKRPYVRRSR